MSNIKKLDCPFKRYKGEHEWFKQRNDNLDYELKTYYTEVPTVVGTDGWYYQGGNCWYEFGGKAYLARPLDFMYTLGIIEAGEHSKAEYLALKQLDRLNSKLLTEGQKGFLYQYGQYLHSKSMKVQTLVNIKSMKQRAVKMESK